MSCFGGTVLNCWRGRSQELPGGLL